MAASYKKLFKILIDREMKSKDLAAKAGISPATCTVCSSNYHQEIITILKRYHSSYEESQKEIETRFCPSCGRLLAKK